MEKEEILELFRITDEKVAQIHASTEEKIASIRSQAEEEKRQVDTKIAIIRSKAEEEKRQNDAKIAAIRSKNEKEIAAIRSKAEEEKRQADAKIASIRSKNEKEIAAIRSQAEEERREREKALKRVSRHLGDYTKSVANIAEEYFYRCLKGNPYLGTLHFDEVLWDEKYEGKQYDLIMRNSKYVALISVKTNLKEKAVIDLVKKDLPTLKQYYSKFKGYEYVKFIGAVAGLTCKDRALAQANTHGIWVLTQSENKQAKLVNEEVNPHLF